VRARAVGSDVRRIDQVLALQRKNGQENEEG